MFIFSRVILVVLLADFVSGFIHWLEDVYAKPGMRWISKIAEDNLLHHTRPREFLKKNWWQSSWDIALLASFLVVGAWWFDCLNWQVVLFAVLVANANQVHKWAHKSRYENHAIVTFLQKIYVLQNARHHAKHHSDDKNTHYCVMTNFLNPVLEKIQFWRGLERFNRVVFGH